LNEDDSGVVDPKYTNNLNWDKCLIGHSYSIIKKFCTNYFG